MKWRLATLMSFLILISFSGPASAQADFDPSKWEYFKEINVPEPVKSEYAYFQVDAEIYDGCHDGLHSLRIIDNKSNEIPYEIVMQAGDREQKEFASEILENSYISGKYNSLTLDTGEEQPEVNEVEIAIAGENFMRHAAVEGSNDQKEWHTLITDDYIYDFSHNVHSRDLRIGFPLSSYRFLLIKVYDNGNGSLKLTDAKIYKVKREDAETTSWLLTIIDYINRDDEQMTEIVADAVYRGLPIQQMEAGIDSQNYRRNVDIQSSEDRKEWTTLGSSVVFDYSLPYFKRKDDVLSFEKNVNGRYFKLILYNFDNEPLRVTKLAGVSLDQRVVFPLKGESPYKAYFGNKSAGEPQYDTSRHFAYAETEDLPRLSLGARQSNTGSMQPVAGEEPASNYFFWFVLIAAIIVFVVLILAVSSKPAEPKE